jgi:hypothetical protein
VPVSGISGQGERVMNFGNNRKTEHRHRLARLAERRLVEAAELSMSGLVLSS